MTKRLELVVAAEVAWMADGGWRRENPWGIADWNEGFPLGSGSMILCVSRGPRVASCAGSTTGKQAAPPILCKGFLVFNIPCLSIFRGMAVPRIDRYNAGGSANIRMTSYAQYVRFSVAPDVFASERLVLRFSR